jgi:hypothetical protein
MDGTPSGYEGNLKSKGIFIVGAHVELGHKIKLHGWNLLAENIFNTALLQTDLSFPLQNSSSFFTSAQVIRQDAVNDGGNKEVAKAYIEKG